MNSISQALKGKIKGAEKKIIGLTSDVLSAPKRISYGMKQRQNEQDTNTLKMARKYDNAPNLDERNIPTNALKWRTMADEVRMRRKS